MDQLSDPTIDAQVSKDGPEPKDRRSRGVAAGIVIAALIIGAVAGALYLANRDVGPSGNEAIVTAGVTDPQWRQWMAHNADDLVAFRDAVSQVGLAAQRHDKYATKDYAQAGLDALSRLDELPPTTPRAMIEAAIRDGRQGLIVLMVGVDNQDDAMIRQAGALLSSAGDSFTKADRLLQGKEP
jgi:hypothetical protein